MKSLRTILEKKTFVAILFMIFSCVEPYTPPSVDGDPNYVVVDGFLNASERSCSVRLSRAVALSNEAGFEEVHDDPLNPIQVWVEDESENKYQLAKVALGQYKATDLPLDNQRKYRLKVNLSVYEEYVSDFVEVKQTPPIESVTFEPGPEKLKLFVNTSDPSGKSGYYRWTWEETWEYTSPLPSHYLLTPDTVIPRPAEQQIYRCYRNDPSNKILIASSEGLVTDEIRNFLIQSIDRSSQKLQYRYSLNVKQQALSEDAYTYWLNLYKTTENVGGLFDPMPGEVRGNFRSTKDASEIVIGFFSAATVEEKRIWITPDDLGFDYSTFRHAYCEEDTILNQDLMGVPKSTLLIGQIYSTGGLPVLIGYSTSTLPCIDCRRIHGGVTTKPPFWP